MDRSLTCILQLQMRLLEIANDCLFARCTCMSYLSSTYYIIRNVNELLLACYLRQFCTASLPSEDITNLPYIFPVNQLCSVK